MVRHSCKLRSKQFSIYLSDLGLISFTNISTKGKTSVVKCGKQLM